MAANILPTDPPNTGDGVNSKKESKNQKSIQSSTIPVPGYQMDTYMFGLHEIPPTYPCIVS